MKDVQQKTLTAGEATAFDMRLKRSQFLVKNFTDGNIRVKLGDNDSYSMIAANSLSLFSITLITKYHQVQKLQTS